MPPSRTSRVDRRLKELQATTDTADLIAALDDPSALVVEAAAKRIKTEVAAAALLAAYRRLHAGAPAADPGCWARIALIEALGRIQAPQGEGAALLAIRSVQVERVSNGQVDTATGLRVAAAGLLGNLRPPGALIDLAWLLFDFEPNNICSPQERPYAKLAARVAAARAIGAFADPAGSAVLAVKLAFQGDDLAETLVECMDGLAALKEPRMIELLRPFLRSTNAYLAGGAATALAAGCGAAAVPVLEQAVETVPRDAQEPLLYAIASIRAQEAPAALSRLCDHPEPAVRALARLLTGSDS